jgi:hypothetical protein
MANDGQAWSWKRRARRCRPAPGAGLRCALRSTAPKVAARGSGARKPRPQITMGLRNGRVGAAHPRGRKNSHGDHARYSNLNFTR